MTVQDWGQGAGALGSAWPYILVGTGAVLVSSAGDRAVDRFVQNRAGSSAIDRLASFGEWSPLAAVGVAGLAALSESDSRLSNAGIAALQAGATGYLASATLKYAVGRARPAAESGPTDFEPFGRSDASFPSNHATIMWAAVTPFAREYDAPWLYGLAALTNAGRIASREHWLSDTVASTVIGWAIGDFFWEQRKKGGDKAPKVAIGPSGVTLMWETK
jgi:membrane-associated phospholipid phosphatase